MLGADGNTAVYANYSGLGVATLDKAITDLIHVFFVRFILLSKTYKTLPNKRNLNSALTHK